MAIQNIIQIMRSVIAGKRPPADPAQAGMPFVNFADKEFGIMDAAGAATDLLAVRHYSALAKYKANDLINKDGVIHKAKADILPGAWSAAAWDPISTQLGETATTAYRGDHGKAVTDGLAVAVIDIATNKATGVSNAAAAATAQTQADKGVADAATADAKAVANTATGVTNATATAVAKTQADKGVADAAIADGKAVANTVVITTNTAQIATNKANMSVTKYKQTKNYVKGDMVSHINEIWFAKTNVTVGVWNIDQWQPIGVRTITQDVVATVGPTGDFPNINTAIQYYANFYPIYGDDGISVKLVLQTGFVIAEQIITDGVNFGWITIESSGTNVHTCTTAAFTINIGSTTWPDFPFYGVLNNGVGPKINLNIKGDNILSNKYSAVSIKSGGSANSDHLTISGFYTAILVAYGGLFTILEDLIVKNNNVGVTANMGAKINAGNIDASHSNVGISVSRSAVVTAGTKIDVTYSKHIGIRAYSGSSVTAISIDASNTGNTQLGSTGIQISQGASVSAYTTVTIQNGLADALMVYSGGHLSADELIADHCAKGIKAINGGTISVRNKIDVTHCKAISVVIAAAGFISCGGALNARKTTTDSAADLFIITGGIIQRKSGNGGSNIAPGVFTAKGYRNV